MFVDVFSIFSPKNVGSWGKIEASLIIVTYVVVSGASTPLFYRAITGTYAPLHNDLGQCSSKDNDQTTRLKARLAAPNCH